MTVRTATWLRLVLVAVAVVGGWLALDASIDAFRAELWMQRAQEHRRWGRLEAASEALERAAEIAPGDAAVHEALGRIYASLARFRESDEAEARSLRAFERAQELHPLDPGVRAARAAALASFGRPGDALAAIDDAIGLDPHNAYYHARRGELLEELGRRDQALSAYRRALAIMPTDDVEARVDRLSSSP